jgi:hypothetical protein
MSSEGIKPVTVLLWLAAFLCADVCLAVAVGKYLARNAAVAGRVPPAR